VTTTLILDRDVADRVKLEMRRSGRTLRAVVNDALRRGFGLATKPISQTPFVVRPHAFGFKAGIDLDRLNQFADELESVEIMRKHSS
jgi:hypothetical protein